MEKSATGLSLEGPNNQTPTQGFHPHPSSIQPPHPHPPMMMISNNNSTSSTISSSSSQVFHHNHHHHQNSNPSTPRTPQPTNNNNNNNNSSPYPTTFVQADTFSFKHVVQMFTGSSETAKVAASSKPTTPRSSPAAASSSDPNLNSKNIFIPPIRPVSKPKPSKLYERRNSLRAGLGISPLVPSSAKLGYSLQQQQQQHLLSPSLALNFPGLVLSPVTPLIPDPFNRSLTTTASENNNNNNAVIVDKFAEEKAIADKGFYLHPSPRELTTSSPNNPPPPPRLLPLFPVTSDSTSSSLNLNLNLNLT